MAGYTKLFSSIVGSTIWREPDHVRLVWVTMLALADADGVVEVSVPGLADFARVPLASCEEALRRLQEPDPYSRTPDHDGRRIEPVSGGWLLLNHGAYRERPDKDTRREYLRQKKQESRARSRRVNTVNTSQQMSTPVAPGRQTSTQAEAAPEAAPEEDLKAPSRQDAEPPALAGAQILVSLWNATMPNPPFTHVRVLTVKRRRHAEARLREHSIAAWRHVFTTISQSPFHRGGGDRGWVAGFDWCIGGPDVAVKALEGQFGETSSRKPSGLPRKENPVGMTRFASLGAHEPA